MNAIFPADTEIEFPVRSVGRLRLGPGKIHCRVGWGGVHVQDFDSPVLPGTEGPEELSWIDGCVEFADTSGKLFRFARPVGVYYLLLAAAFGRPRAELDNINDMITQRIQGIFSRRDEQLLMCHRVDGPRIFSYRLKQSYATLSLGIARGGPSDRLVIGVKEMDDRGLDWTSTPSATFESELAAVLVLAPTMVDEFNQYPAKVRPAFEETGSHAAPNPHIRFLE